MRSTWKHLLLIPALLFSGAALARDAVPGLTAEVLETEHGVPIHLADRIEATLRKVMPGTKLPTPLVLAIMKIESEFNPRAKSSAGAVGLMQVMPRWHVDRVREISNKPALTFNDVRKELLDVETNIEAGVSILAECYNRYNSLTAAAQCYNGGPPRAESSYTKKVMRAYREMAIDLGVRNRAAPRLGESGAHPALPAQGAATSPD